MSLFSILGGNSLETMVSAWNQQIEAKIAIVAATIVHDGQVLESDITAGLAYMTAHLPQIEAGLKTVAEAVSILPGIGSPSSEAMTAIADALVVTQTAGVALAAYNADMAAGKPQIVAYADLAAAFLNAKQASAQAQAAVANTAAPTAK